MKTKSFFALVIAALLLFTPVSTFACACCSEPGSYFSGTVDFSEHSFGEFQRIRFARPVSLFLNAAGLEENANGIDRPRQHYSMSASLEGKVLKLSFRGGGNTGVLELPLPDKMWNHAVDINDRKLSAGGGPLLYKEWRFEGDVRGTGIFKAGTSSPAKYVLVLQGRGNGCDNAEDFSNWRVEVTGEKAGYAFYGKLATVKGRP